MQRTKKLGQVSNEKAIEIANNISNSPSRNYKKG
jgi:hypothetical protein